MSTYSGLPTYHDYCSFSSKEMVNVEGEIEKLIDIGVIIESSPKEGEFTSSIFLLTKEDN